jgi:hypothetical protein
LQGDTAKKGRGCKTLIGAALMIAIGSKKAAKLWQRGAVKPRPAKKAKAAKRLHTTRKRRASTKDRAAARTH